MSLGGGGGGNQTVSNEPPEWMKPYIQDTMKQGQNLYSNYSPQYYPGSTVAPQSPYTQQAIQGMGQFGNSSFNQNLIGNAQQGQQTLAGMGNNPALQAGTHQIGGGSPFIDWTRSRAMNMQPDQFGAGVQGQQMFGQGPTTPQSGFSQMAGGLDPTAAINSQMNTAPGTNPYIDEMVQRSLGANTKNFNQQVMPNIDNSADMAGGYGGSRHGIAQGLAMQGLNDTNAQTAANIYSNQYNQDLARQAQASALAAQMGAQGAQLTQNQLGQDRNFNLGTTQLGLQAGAQNEGFVSNAIQQGLGGTELGFGLYGTGQQGAIAGSQGAMALAPGLQQMGLTGLQATGMAGDAQNQYNQNVLNDAVNRFNFYQQQPWQNLQNYSNIVQGGGGGGAYGTTTTPNGGSGGVAGALGGAATGAGIWGGLATAGITLSNPVGWGIIALGALGGLFG